MNRKEIIEGLGDVLDDSLPSGTNRRIINRDRRTISKALAQLRTDAAKIAELETELERLRGYQYIPIDQIPKEWKDGQELILRVSDLDISCAIGYWASPLMATEDFWAYVHNGKPIDKQVTHAALPLPTPEQPNE